MRSGRLVALIMAIALCLPLSAAAERFALASRAVIATGPGGSVIEYARLVSNIRMQNAQVQFSGRCESACTMFLSLPASRTCIMPGASFTFHRAYGASEDFNQWGTEYMMSGYPVWVRRWIADRGGLSDRLLRMNYAYAARFIPPCGQAARSLAAARS
ncbi:hypothetical protein E2K80_14645 [Rhodophyticola sp. CCM32]|uniref:hypothetical protein n=1 Tax=Rhodophyticola sp. CCM32 TaxID=2916397 RepID=UPI00107F74CF|nr:hypothetical protein [Rhodophyticola sp. CCM32]QBY01809.1 hypothetical protein E2K80_14645 [Rhodophyticola sp. CCM32]